MPPPMMMMSYVFMRIAFQSALIQKGGDGHVIQSQAEIGGHGSSVRIALDSGYLVDLLRFIECGVKEL